MSSKNGEETFGERLRRLLTERSFTSRALSRATDCPQSTLSGWLRGSTPSDFHAVKRIAETLGVSLSYLLTGEVDSPPDASELFQDGDTILDGVVDVRIRKLVPREKGKAPGKVPGA